MITNKIPFLKIIVIISISVSFFLGYIFRENSTGGGPEFFELSWPIIQSFKENFLYTIKNYGMFRDYTIPFSHIINAYLNPFSDVISHFQLSVTIISFMTFFIFALAVKKIFFSINFIDILLTSSALLLLPFFRTSAFWGKNENYGWLFLILALYFFSKIKKDIHNNPKNVEIFNIIFFCFTSACALYARQALAFLPISYFLYLFFNKANKKIIIASAVSFFIFAIPSLFLIMTWGNVFDVKNQGTGSFFGWWINFNHILKNFPILLSFWGFYLLPFLFLELLNSNLKLIFHNYFKSFLFSLIVFIILLNMNFLDYLGEYTIAGGAILKVNYLIAKNNFILLLVFSSIGFSILLRLFKENPRNNATILLPILIIYGFPNLLYQEYFEPLILIIFFLALDTDMHKKYFNKISLSNFIFISYFAIYLLGSIYFKHFAFDSYEKWKIFLNTQ